MPRVKASSFADPADVAAYRKAIKAGKTEKQALKLGDNGIGRWGDDMTSVEMPMCALPPEDWKSRWGTRGARGKRVRVTYNGQTVVGELRDTMPAKTSVKNGAGIDLNPGFAKAFGMKQPFMLDNVDWGTVRPMWHRGPRVGNRRNELPIRQVRSNISTELSV